MVLPNSRIMLSINKPTFNLGRTLVNSRSLRVLVNLRAALAKPHLRAYSRTSSSSNLKVRFFGVRSNLRISFNYKLQLLNSRIMANTRVFPSHNSRPNSKTLSNRWANNMPPSNFNRLAGPSLRPTSRLPSSSRVRVNLNFRLQTVSLCPTLAFSPLLLRQSLFLSGSSLLANNSNNFLSRDTASRARSQLG